MNMLPTPHGDKLQATLANEKLPAADKARVSRALKKYSEWKADLASLPAGNPGGIDAATELLQAYRLYVDVELIFDSPDDFLYRQKGQLKLDNSVLEEFLPYLARIALASDLIRRLKLGPQACYSALYFGSHIAVASKLPGMQVRSKDQDFAISRQVTIEASFPTLGKAKEHKDSVDTHLAYFCAECKTNLDKTMFQEAVATAHDLKTAVAGAKYYLLCEWLDMSPISTAGTDIDEVLVLRKARRLGAQIRSDFSSAAGRKKRRAEYLAYLTEHPFSVDVLRRVMNHMQHAFDDSEPEEKSVLIAGYF